MLDLCFILDFLFVELLLLVTAKFAHTTFRRTQADLSLQPAYILRWFPGRSVWEKCLARHDMALRASYWVIWRDRRRFCSYRRYLQVGRKRYCAGDFLRGKDQILNLMFWAGN